MVLKYTLGDNWNDYFDFIGCMANKPLFQRANFPFYRIERTPKIAKGEAISTGKDLLE
jgi:hypothetical protein